MTDRLYSRPEGITETLADRLEKPLLDNRTYRVIRLPNQLEALLVHDADTDQASAAMDVHVGSMSDPEEMQGMAHAVEHLLFMGTEKYPGENDYNSYLTKFGGHSNAFTAPTSTNYYFELSASSKSNSPNSSTNASEASLPIAKGEAPLYGALDRFAQFFVKPLFLEDTLDRELRAVDSENKKNLQSDTWRLMQLNKSLSSKNHPFHLFSTGNYKLLHDDPIARGVKIREEFMKFYEKHYSANRMRLVVLGREGLDELQDWVEELFSPIQNKNLPKLRWDGLPPQTEEELCTQIFAKPVMDARMLDILFPYPDEEDLYETQPGRYIAHLIGHEGPGSILAYLKAKGWVNELSAGPSPVCPGAAFFSIGIRLTSEGLKHYQEVVKTVFHYISMLKESPPKEWIFEESAKLAEIDFKFKQKSPASRTTSQLSGVMQKSYPREWILSGQSLMRRFDPEGITRGLNALRPDNFRYTVVSQEFPGGWDQKEKWYGTEYKWEKIPGDVLKEFERAHKSVASERPAELHLPHKNEFLPTRLDVEKKDVLKPSLVPKLIRNDTNMRLWFKKDDQFWVPKANIYVYLRTPIMNETPFLGVTSHLYKDLVDDSLTEYAYDAELAGLEYNITRLPEAWEISVSGYNDKMHVLLEKVLTSLRDLEFKQERFDIIKERLARGLRNTEYSEPFRQVNTYTRWLGKETQWITDDFLEELPAVTADDVRRLFPQLLRQMHMEIMVHGNLYKEDALRIGHLVEMTLKPLPLPKRQWPSSRMLAYPAGSDYRYERTLKNPDNVNHCIEYVVTLGDIQDRPLRAKMLLLSQMLEEPVFDTLRTKEQLGYIVGGGALAYPTLGKYRILVQSEKDCEYVEKRIENFLTNFETDLKEMPHKEFEAHKIGIINKRLEKLKNLSQESGRLWHHITSEAFDFELVYRDVENIEPLTQQDIVDFFVKHFKPDSPSRIKSCIYMIAQTTAADIAANTSPAEQQEKLAAGVAELLGQLGVTVDTAALSTQLEKIDLAKGDVESITANVGKYLQKAAGIAAEQVEAIVQQAQAVLPQFLPQLGIKPQAATPEAANGHANGTTNGHTSGETPKSNTIIIKDVKKFKESLPLTAAAHAVKDVSEFEDLEPKL
ncbi:hypothetical protein M409DRAFT_19100 [Zasmidium cellare ATCC 36951]|uniref:Peptidase M16 N-terminal domain-containing protein n=1 Tax=Zasmidium cellare ATCC 36951 TaxID=1080233 RepID=A0A6A6CZ90_ZASCE|nr:uncharacterized protein M409DRAFT_19100 [Zasmidium cellare ATCC 36951]KAF2171129.1 hypothetical protein M409DRAFT_19100 [Zasmidium cellare ATCC 36951]